MPQRSPVPVFLERATHWVLEFIPSTLALILSKISSTTRLAAIGSNFVEDASPVNCQGAVVVE